jgi:two-component system CheB/CheR fusion protein
MKLDAPDPARVPELADAGLRPLAGMRVLLVDDTPDMLETFSYLLEARGVQVTPAGSGAEALSASANGEFDLLISDIGMPQMDGYELIARLRRQPRTKALPAIALTGHGQPQDIERALAAGFDAHLDKPVDVGRIDVLIAQVLIRAASAHVAAKAAVRLAPPGQGNP